MSQKMQRAHDLIARTLAGLEVELFTNPDDYRLTLVARNVHNPKAHIIVSNEIAEERCARVRQALTEVEAEPGHECHHEGAGA